jgi:hypothetical protein
MGQRASDSESTPRDPDLDREHPVARRGSFWAPLAAGALTLVFAPDLFDPSTASLDAALLSFVGLLFFMMAASEWRGDSEDARDWLWVGYWVSLIVALSSPASALFVGRLWPTASAALRTDPAGTLWIGLTLLVAVAVGLRAGFRRLRRRREAAIAG